MQPAHLFLFYMFSAPTGSIVQCPYRLYIFVDLLVIGGMLGMLLGGIYGFVLDFGPVIWGLIGMIGGAVVGLLVEFLLSGPKMFKRTTTADVVLIVDCSDAQTAAVERILWQHQPLGVAKQPMSTAD